MTSLITSVLCRRLTFGRPLEAPAINGGPVGCAETLGVDAVHVFSLYSLQTMNMKRSPKKVVCLHSGGKICFQTARVLGNLGKCDFPILHAKAEL